LALRSFSCVVMLSPASFAGLHTRPAVHFDQTCCLGSNQFSEQSVQQQCICAGPVLLEDYHLIEKLAQFDRERIPERVVHARGATAKGFFEVSVSVHCLPCICMSVIDTSP